MSDSRAERVRECLDRDVPLTRALVADLLAAYDERLRVNVGLVMENAELRRRLSLS